jgi:hypothetical protein
MKPERPPPRPSCHGLLDANIRAGMRTYRLLGFVGTVVTEAGAYIELLEEELARREAEDTPK